MIEAMPLSPPTLGPSFIQFLDFLHQWEKILIIKYFSDLNAKSLHCTLLVIFTIISKIGPLLFWLCQLWGQWGVIKTIFNFKEESFLNLPCRFEKINQGFSPAEKFVGNQFHAMKIQENLMWDKHTCKHLKHIGFVDLSDGDFLKMHWEKNEDA